MLRPTVRGRFKSCLSLARQRIHPATFCMEDRQCCQKRPTWLGANRQSRDYQNAKVTFYSLIHLGSNQREPLRLWSASDQCNAARFNTCLSSLNHMPQFQHFDRSDVVEGARDSSVVCVCVCANQIHLCRIPSQHKDRHHDPLSREHKTRISQKYVP